MVKGKFLQFLYYNHLFRITRLVAAYWRSDFHFLHNLVSERRNFLDKLGCFISRVVEIFFNIFNMHGGAGGLQFCQSKSDSISDSFPYHLCIVIPSSFKQTSEIFEFWPRKLIFSTGSLKRGSCDLDPISKGILFGALTFSSRP